MSSPAASSIVLLLGGLAFVGFGSACALWPARMAAPRDLPLDTPTARTDFRATYGGFQLGFGLFLVGSAVSPRWTPVGLWAILAALLGFAGLRASAIVLERGKVRRSMWVGLGLEVTGAIAAGWALSRPS